MSKQCGPRKYENFVKCHSTQLALYNVSADWRHLKHRSCIHTWYYYNTPSSCYKSASVQIHVQHIHMTTRGSAPLVGYARPLGGGLCGRPVHMLWSTYILLVHVV